MGAQLRMMIDSPEHTTTAVNICQEEIFKYIIDNNKYPQVTKVTSHIISTINETSNELLEMAETLSQKRIL